jgi:hypothetical protein
LGQHANEEGQSPNVDFASEQVVDASIDLEQLTRRRLRSLVDVHTSAVLLDR